MTTSDEPRRPNPPQPQNSIQYDAFLSYHEDMRDEAKKLCTKLVAHGLIVWFDRNKLVEMKSTSRLSHVVAGISASWLFVCLVTRSYAHDKDCDSELSIAYDANKKIVPVMFENAKMSELGGVGFKISRLSRVNVFADPFFLSLKFQDDSYASEKFDELVRVASRELGRELRFDETKVVRSKENGSSSYLSLASDLGYGVAKIARMPLKPLGIDRLGKFLR